jgi:outer membrane protein insertion porin family
VTRRLVVLLGALLAAGPVPAGAQAAPPTEADAVAWRDWVVEGTVIDDLAVVRGFVAPVMQRNRLWGSSAQLEIREVLLQLGYEASFASRRAGGGGVQAVIVVVPVPSVRSISTSIDMRARTRIFDPLFREELLRQLHVRPGSPLPIDPAARTEQLAQEARRLEIYLQNQGFYDAEVAIAPRPSAPFTLTLDVDIKPGRAYRVGKVTVAGNDAVDTREIVKIFRDHPYFCLFADVCFGAKRFTKSQLNRDVEKLVTLYRKRGYPGVSVQTDFDLRHSFQRASKSVTLHIDVRERRKVDVVFDGLSGSVREDRLAEELTLDDEGSYDDVEIERSAEAVRRYLQRDGYFEANVAWERARFGLFERVIMSVDQGPKLRIREVDFVGNRALPDDELAKEIKTKPYRRLGLGETGGYAVSAQLEADAEQVAARYRAAGYADVRVRPLVARQVDLLDNAAAQAAAIAADLPTSGLWVRFVVDEGPRVVVDKAVLEFKAGDQVVGSGLPEDVLRRRLKQRRGRPFDAAVVDADAGRLRDAYFEAGYPRAQVTTQIEAGRVDRRRVVHTINPGEAVRIGKVAIRGNYRTREWVIRDELRADEGALLTRRRVERMRANLQSSGLFSTAQVELVGDKAGEGVVNLLVKVEERHDNRGEVLVGLGGASDSGTYATGQYKLNNALGIGAAFQLTATPSLERINPWGPWGQPRDEVEARLVLPRWIGDRLFGVGVVLETTAQWRGEDTERFGRLTTYGFGQAVTYAFRGGLFDRWALSMRYDFRVANRDIDLFRPAGNSDDLEKTKVTSIASTVGPDLIIDRREDAQGRPNPLAPSRGFFIRASGKFAEDYLVGTDRFIKLGVSGQHFLPLGDRFQLSSSTSYDHGIPLGGEVVLPEVERFFAGGDTTVRGFEQDRLKTEIVEDALAPGGGVTQFRVLPAGGNTRFIYRLDLQAKVWAIGSMPVASAFFVDTGLVTNSIAHAKLRDLRHSAGVALARLVSPFGNFSFEWAVPLDPELGDNPIGRFHLTFGANFGI